MFLGIKEKKETQQRGTHPIGGENQGENEKKMDEERMGVYCHCSTYADAHHIGDNAYNKPFFGPGGKGIATLFYSGCLSIR